MPNITGHRSMRGYTFFELLIVIGVTIIFGSVAMLNLPVGLRTKTEIDNAVSNIRVHLLLVQQRSIAQENGSKWGIHFDNSTPGSNFYQIFYGNTYETGTVVETIYLPDGIIFLSPAQGNIEDIIFEKVTGKTEYGHSIVIGLESVSGELFNNTNSGSISVSAGTGLIALLSSVPTFGALISLNPGSATIYVGSFSLTTVSVSILSGISEAVTFFAAGLPANTTASFSPVNCSPSCTSNLTLQTSQNTPVGTYPITISATAGVYSETAIFSLAVIAPTAPGAPTGLAGTSGDGQVSLSWQAPALTGGSPITNYKIYRGTSPGGETFLADAGNVLIYTNTGLTNGTTYYYKVAAQNAIGVGSQSNEASGRPNFNVSGWAWSNDIGWISFNCDNNASCGTVNYGVNADSDNGLMSGYAWSENIGWISFNSSDLTGCPSGICEARVSGGLTGSFPKNVTGWAKVLSSGSWVHLAGMSQDGNAYSVQLASDGDFSGWSWEPDILGWLHWKDVLYNVKATW